MSFVAASGGQLFTEQQVVDFSREMDEWITVPTREGGAGVEFHESNDDTDCRHRGSKKKTWRSHVRRILHRDPVPQVRNDP